MFLAQFPFIPLSLGDPLQKGESSHSLFRYAFMFIFLRDINVHKSVT